MCDVDRSYLELESPLPRRCLRLRHLISKLPVFVKEAPGDELNLQNFECAVIEDHVVRQFVESQACCRFHAFWRRTADDHYVPIVGQRAGRYRYRADIITRENLGTGCDAFSLEPDRKPIVYPRYEAVDLWVSEEDQVVR